MSLQGVTLVHASAEFAAEHTHKRRHCEDPTRAWRDINGSGVVVSARDAHALITRSHAFTLAGECECGVAGCTCTQGPDAPRTALPFRVNRTRLQHRELMVVPANEPGTRRSFCCEGFSNFALSASGQARCRKRPSDSTVLGVIERQCFCGALVIREKTTVALLATGRHVLTILKLGSQHGALCSEATPAQRMTITARWRVKVAAGDRTLTGTGAACDPSLGGGPAKTLKNVLQYERQRRMDHLPPFHAVHSRLSDMLGRCMGDLSKCNVLLYNPPSDTDAKDYAAGGFVVLVEMKDGQENMAKYAREGLLAHDDKVAVTPDGLNLTAVRPAHTHACAGVVCVCARACWWWWWW